MNSTQDLVRVMSSDGQRIADQETIEAFGLSGRTLMELAGSGAARVMGREFAPLAGRRIAIFCGKGNNGGDGFVAGRWLHERGASVDILAPPSVSTADAAHNLTLLRKVASESNRLRIGSLQDNTQADLYVDALLGTGVGSPLREPMLGLVARLNAANGPVVSLDVPTGLHPDRGTVLGQAVRAAYTVTMGALKPGLVLGDGPELAGRVEIVDIGVPRTIMDRAHGLSGRIWLTTDAAVAGLLPNRARHAHKYSVGMALVVGGAPGLTGAPAMASRAAARIGAGYVTCATRASLQPVLAGKLTEIATVALPETDSGRMDVGQALRTLEVRMAKASAILVGPGLGRDPEAAELARQLVRTAELPMVVDADGLNALVDMEGELGALARGRLILTPHEGEFRRLVDIDLADRVGAARACAERWNSTLLLKGMPSVVASPTGEVYICATGNPALATAGTGDVLAGLCAGLLAQGLSPTEAAVCAVHLGGAASDRYASRGEGRSMMAMDLVRELPGLLSERFS